MENCIRTPLSERLNRLNNKQRKKVMQEASRLREAFQRSKQSGKPNRPKPRTDGLDPWVAAALESLVAEPDASLSEPSSESEAPIVVELQRGQAIVRIADRELRATLHADIASEQQSAIAVGDRVVLSCAPTGERFVDAVLPRRSKLSRLDPANPGRDRVIAANIDAACIVVAAKTPAIRPKLIDRFLVAIQQGGAHPIVVVNKWDQLLDAPEREAVSSMLRDYEAAGASVVRCSAVTGEGLTDLRQAIAEQTVAFAGSSGVGKSSLLNALDPRLGIKEGAVSDKTGKGRHTTTFSRMVEVGSGTWVIDTPGIKSFGLDERAHTETESYFPEIHARSADCRFPDCSHSSEPGCAVRNAVHEGSISKARYESFLKLSGGRGPRDTPSGDEQGWFECAQCGFSVLKAGAGSQHRNHCPRCLSSLHLDDSPGDRLACCGGIMEPVAVWVRKGGEWALIHRCKTCGAFSSNRVAADDNETLLMSLAVRPLAQPPFPLERLGDGDQ